MHTGMDGSFPKVEDRVFTQCYYTKDSKSDDFKTF